MKSLASGVRSQFGLATARVMRSDLRRIYKFHSIQIDMWPHKLRKIRGAYFNDELGPTVMVAKKLPDDPMVFTLAHELKHHLVDRHLPIACCSERNQNEHIEIGAEIFAAELIFPEELFISSLSSMGVGTGACTPEHIVRLKRETRTTLSYAGLAKRATFLRFSNGDALARVQWKKLEEQIFGVPFYKQRRLSRH